MSTEKEIKNEATVVASAEQTANAEVQTPKKRRGRGINNDLRDVTRKKFVIKLMACLLVILKTLKLIGLH